MNEKWKQWNIELNEAIEKPTNNDIVEMDELHLKLYQTWKKMQELKEDLELVQNEFNELKEQLDIKNLPNWCWIWIKKKSRIAWKEEFINRLGQVSANKVSAAAKQKEYPQIGIRFIDPKPEDIPINPETKKRQEKPKRLKLTEPKKKKLKLLNL
jgi:hypothetical protein